MSKYTTGEIAKLCGVSVRTVQYYDSRNILVPSQLSEGGRRLYSEEDLKRMRIICFLREAGIPINGIGQLFSEEHPEKVISIELDKRLEKVLEETLAGFSNISFIWEDCLKVDLKELMETEFSGMDVSVAANLPYYITTPIIMNLLESRLPFKKIVVMIQKEVAERLCAKPGSKDYGAITVTTQYFSKPEIIKKVPAGAFIPAPKVDSAVVSMEILDTPSVTPKDEKLFFKLIKAAFSQRRKTLVNALSSSGAFGSKEDVTRAVESVGLSPTVRGEALSVEEFCRLSDYFS